jgi:integration host factor subunit beta
MIPFTRNPIREDQMTKTNLIEKLSEKMKIQPREAKVIVENLFDAMKESLERGERIEIRGFGSFVIKQYSGYKGRNPRTGEIIDIPPKKLPYFKVGKELKDLVNKQGME